MSAKTVAASLLAGALWMSAAQAQEVGDAATGRRVAQALCRDCHVERGPGGRGPAFADVARMPATTATMLTVYLRTSHPPMPDILLTPAEQEDVIAYILSLRN